MEYTSPWAGLDLTTLVVIGTDCIQLPYDHDHDGPASPIGLAVILEIMHVKTFKTDIVVYVLDIKQTDNFQYQSQFIDTY